MRVSIKFSEKMIILIVTKNQDFILTLKDTFFKKTHEWGVKLTPLAILGLKVKRWFARNVLKILSLYEAALLMRLRIAVNDFHQHKSRHSFLRLLKLRTWLWRGYWAKISHFLQLAFFRELHNYFFGNTIVINNIIAGCIRD